MIKGKKNTKEKLIKKMPTINVLQQLNPFVAGIDIGSRSHFVAAPIASGKDTEIYVKEFSSFTSDLQELAQWLKECQVISVVMESTGVYWIPLYELLESQGFEVLLVDARHVKNVTGRKTDIKDCQWLQQLHACGLLRGAFRPADKILPLRSYIRQRQMLIASSSRCVQHMQKAMTQMNLHLSNVISDITGLTGMQIIRAIVAGERNPKKLAEFRDPRCKTNQETIEKSLIGNWRPEHLFALKQALELFDFYQGQILKCDHEIEETLKQLNLNLSVKSEEDQRGKPKVQRFYKSKDGNALYFDPVEDLKSILGVDVTKVPGLSGNMVMKIIAEIGLDMKKWATAQHFSSWLGLCPENKVSGGKRLSSKTKPTANRAAECFRMAAFSLSRSQTALGGFYRRIKSRQGTPKALTATARKIAVILYNMLTKGIEYVEAGLNYYEEQYERRVLKNLQKRAESLGYCLAPINSSASSSENMEVAYS